MNAIARGLRGDNSRLRQQLGEGEPGLLPLLGGEDDGSTRGNFPTAGVGGGISPIVRHTGGASGGSGRSSISGSGGISPGSARRRFDLLAP